ncbi:MAG: hypothetical protein QOC78_1771 [Solirubrobacteraceae bacterium]|jgi:transcriptional regulator with XRE-family HTH domain|nr:hypothetical protein [Solirubrobacteraceae bacterium]
MALSPDHEAFGAAVRELRERRGISQRALAELLGSSQPTLSALEHGQRNPGLDAIFRLCESLDVSFVELAEAVDRHRQR